MKFQKMTTLMLTAVLVLMFSAIEVNTTYADEEIDYDAYVEAEREEKKGFFRRMFRGPMNILKSWNDTDPAEFDAYDPVTRERSNTGLRLRKLGRGFTNVLTGWIEIPKSIDQKWRETDPVTGTITGTVEGVAWGVTRTAVGVYEVLSFPFGAPNNFEPMLKPEYILPSVWGAEWPISDRIDMEKSL